MKAVVEDAECCLIQRTESPEEDIKIDAMIWEPDSQIKQSSQSLFVVRRLPYLAQRRPLLGRWNGLIERLTVVGNHSLGKLEPGFKKVDNLKWNHPETKVTNSPKWCRSSS